MRSLFFLFGVVALAEVASLDQCPLGQVKCLCTGGYYCLPAGSGCVLGPSSCPLGAITTGTTTTTTVIVATVAPKPRKGTCPAPVAAFGPCIVACSSDDSCPFNQKCCANGCGKTCQIAVCSCFLIFCLNMFD